MSKVVPFLSEITEHDMRALVLGWLRHAVPTEVSASSAERLDHALYESFRRYTSGQPDAAAFHAMRRELGQNYIEAGNGEIVFRRSTVRHIAANLRKRGRP